ncbi:hypothetical protein IT411_02350, partial [Candidatus Peregrinibacteria bacterium]|nr:hypothetical protein [Candidatus Peregrinibacteria bacterium]
LREIDFSAEFNGDELKLIQAIKLGDLEKDEVLKKRFTDWLNQEAEKAEKSGDFADQILMSLRRAKLLFQAASYNDAFREAMDARTYAENMQGQLGEEADYIIDESNRILLSVVEKSK